jgi:hypothetical protein
VDASGTESGASDGQYSRILLETKSRKVIAEKRAERSDYAKGYVVDSLAEGIQAAS